MAEKTKKSLTRRVRVPRRPEREGIPKPAVERGTRRGSDFHKWVLLASVSAVISLLLFPNILSRPKVYHLGDVAERDIKASREFLVENKELTEANRAKAVKGVLAVYDFDPGAANAASRVREAFEAGRQFLAEADSRRPSGLPGPGKRGENSSAEPSPAGVFAERFFEILDVPPNRKVFDILMTYEFPPEAEDVVVRLVTQASGKGIIANRAILRSRAGQGVVLHNIHTGKEMTIRDPDRFLELAEARRFILGQAGTVVAGSSVQPELARACAAIAAVLLRPNVTFNKRETELRKDQARHAVKPFYFKVKKGEMLVREGERIRPEHLLKISEQEKNVGWNEVAGRAPAMFLLVGVLLWILYAVGLLRSPSAKSESRYLLFNAATLLVIFVVVIAGALVSEEIARGFSGISTRAFLFAVPVACGAMLISIFQGIGAAASFALVISTLATLVVGGRIEFFIYFFVSSLAAGHGVKNCRERGVLIQTGLRVGVINMALALAIEVLQGAPSTMELPAACVAAFTGGILTAVTATGLLPLVEMTFGFTTDIKLLELASLDQPLLRDLMVRAPGTYHHSVIVSNLVEASAKAINANPLLVKVAAYYHDIGKMKKPLYFIENQVGGQNKHEKLAPSMSALILMSHVKDGVELAREHKLGREIIDIIQQHHGTSLIRYFYQKALEQSEKKKGKAGHVKEEGFRYPGPKPQTKEAGLVMLADIVEAASKTLVEPTAARIQGMVQKIINKAFSDGQLDECELTLKDLHEIAKNFNKTLSGIFHHRIDYPEPVAKTGQGKKGNNGSPDKLSAESWTEKQDDQAQVGESLKRLGLS
ncbi:MAG: phosphohydrolase [Deltaproteobacteria bacterium]|nr:MAG: phosphohydrolase [Deltaproteobacteria bacterium]